MNQTTPASDPANPDPVPAEKAAVLPEAIVHESDGHVPIPRAAPEQVSIKADIPPAPPPRREPPPRSALATLTAVGFLLLATWSGYLWYQLQLIRVPDSVDPARIAALENTVRNLQQRAAQPAASVDLRPVEQRLNALEQRPAAAPAADNSAALADKLQALEKRLAQSEAATRAAADRAAQAQRMQAAAVALEAGQKLGPLAAAHPSLSRFADTAPPTLAALRLAFPEAARAAASASHPDNSGLPVLERMWQKVESLVTLRQGDKVLIGPPAATVLAASQGRLDAGDLAGAVKSLDGLDPAAAAAIAGWRGQAQALLDARAALAAAANG